MPCIIYGISDGTELRETSLLGHLQNNSLSGLEKIKRMKKSMTYSCQNRRVLKAQRKNEKKEKGHREGSFLLLLLPLSCSVA